MLDGSAIAHIALEGEIGVAPFFGGLAKQSDVEKISFARDVLVGVGSAVPTRPGDETDGHGGFDPALGCEELCVDADLPVRESSTHSAEALQHILDNDMVDGRDQPPLSSQENMHRRRIAGILVFDALLECVNGR